MQENDGLADAAGSRGIVVESRAAQVDELAAHRGKMDAVQRCDKRGLSLPITATTLNTRAKNREFALAFRDENDILTHIGRDTRPSEGITLFENDLETAS